MADFSFSFDSDNPFAEPEQAPKKAPAAPNDPAPVDAPPTGEAAAPEANTPNADSSAADSSAADSSAADSSAADSSAADSSAADSSAADASAADAMALDAFDFTFDGDASDAEPLGAEPLGAGAIALPPSSVMADFDLDSPAQAEVEEVESDEVQNDEAKFDTSPFDLGSPDNNIFAENFEVAEAEVAEAEVAEAEVADAEVAEQSAPDDSEAELNPFAVTDVAAAEPSAQDLAPEALAATTLEQEIAPPMPMPMPEPEQAPEPTGFVSEISVPDAVAAAAVMEPAPAIALADGSASNGEAMELADASEGEPQRRTPKVAPRVAILGASGIGKNHARWFDKHGCQVVGFLGTSEDSTSQTEADLSADFDFQGRGYSDLGELLANEKPDIVCVATPPHLHFNGVLQSLEAGAHVLCEKPLVYAPTRKFRENRDGAKELVKVAAKKKLTLGTQLQYGAATPILCKLAGLAPTEVGDFAMELETPNPQAPRDPHELWIDLGPHPISIAQMLAGPGAKLAEETVTFEPFEDDDKTEVLARFSIVCADGRLLMVRAVVRGLRGEIARKPRRRFSFNGHAVSYAPLQSRKGGFQAQFVAPDGYASVYADPVDYLIGDFLRACRTGEAPLISGDFGRENLEWMLKVGAPESAR